MDPNYQPNRNQPYFKIIVALGALIFICVAVSLVTAQLAIRGKNSWDHDQPHGHHWLKEELGLSPEEAAAIDAFETPYRDSRAELMEEFRSRIATLRELLLTQDDYSSEVQGAILQLHHVHGQLQELSIQHFYEMMSVLPPDKQEQLRALAVKALSQPE